MPLVPDQQTALDLLDYAADAHHLAQQTYRLTLTNALHHLPASVICAHTGLTRSTLYRLTATPGTDRRRRPTRTPDSTTTHP